MSTRVVSLFALSMRSLQSAVAIAGFIAPWVMLGSARQINPLAAMALVLLFGYLATAVHEAGHWLGARLGGMTVLCVRVAALEIQLLRGGFRWRWARHTPGQAYGGYVTAVDKVGEPMRKPRLLLIAMGPLMNLCVALIFLVVGLQAWAGAILALAFAIINLAVGVANLIPTAKPRPSDGHQLLAWLLRPDERGADFAYLRLLAQSAAGVSAAHLPAAELGHLDNAPMPLPLVALAYRLNAQLVIGDWPAALAVEEHFEKLVQQNPQVRKSNPLILSAVRAEAAFCRAISQRNTAGLDTHLLSRELA